MAYCPSGGVRKPGVPQVAHINTTLLRGLLPANLGWLIPFLPLLEQIDIDMDNFCATDPPPMISADPSDLLALVNGGRVGAGLVAANALMSIIRNLVWHQSCQCSVPPTPVMPAPPPYNPAYPIANPTSIVPPGVSAIPCGFGGHAAGWTDTTRILAFDGTDFHPVITYAQPGSTWIRLTLRELNFQAGLDTNLHYECYMATRDLATQPEGTFTLVQNLGTRDVITGTPQIITTQISQQAGTVYNQAQSVGLIYGAVVYMTPAAVSTNSYDVLAEYFCGDQPGVSALPCCPPDASTSLAIRDLDAKLTEVQDLVRSIQRFKVPFAFINGAFLGPFTGDGFEFLPRCAGFKIRVSLENPDAGVVQSLLPTLYDVGWVNLAYPIGESERIFITQEDQLVFDPNVQAIIGVTYHLSPGARIFIHPLLAEP